MYKTVLDTLIIFLFKYRCDYEGGINSYAEMARKHQKPKATTRVLQPLGDKKYSEFKALYIQ